MSKQTAIKVHVDVGADHRIKLPDDVPVGPADLIVLVRAPAAGPTPAPPDALGLFKDEPDLVDELMEHARELRAQSRMRPVS